MTANRRHRAKLALALGCLAVAGLVLALGGPGAPDLEQSTQRADRVPVAAAVRQVAPSAFRSAAPRPALTLVATSRADDPSRSTAALRVGGERAARIARPGEALQGLPDIRLVRVGIRWAEFEDAAGTWTLELTRDEGPPAPGIADLQRILGDPSLDTNARVQQLRAAGAGEPTTANLLSEASFAPHYDERGAFAGLALVTVEPGGFYAKLGLAGGDRLLEVDGIRLDREQAMADVLAALETRRSLHLLVDSGGEHRRLLVDLAPSRLASAF